jgi:hypothetical protein
MARLIFSKVSLEIQPFERRHGRSVPLGAAISDAIAFEQAARAGSSFDQR